MAKILRVSLVGWLVYPRRYEEAGDAILGARYPGRAYFWTKCGEVGRVPPNRVRTLS